ncbi:endoribonuclease YbeY [endosymbiont of Sipalinus gigas]|uniref:rRNA maturation RNase YbeY n=1 Tax=endosymbiont of Sipalinus gigas TaxID=1972134 RepID=UPI000DC72BD3|nr:rRNA maturation RNase YbeY [endosymbiont of Sipalinus gigas]BBA85316.1 endoribonuclease YbeY [endosymbiont of Sipalinus gigas]
MKINIKYINTNKNNIPNYKNINMWVKSVFKYKNKKKIEITIVIVNKNKIRYLNFKFRGIYNYTNILSFKNINIFNKKYNYYGDLVICKNIIEEESLVYKKKINDHWAHIIIHGCLHLLGFDHINNNKFYKMKNIEIKLLKKFNILNPYIK